MVVHKAGAEVQARVRVVRRVSTIQQHSRCGLCMGSVLVAHYIRSMKNSKNLRWSSSVPKPYSISWYHRSQAWICYDHIEWHNRTHTWQSFVAWQRSQQKEAFGEGWNTLMRCLASAQHLPRGMGIGAHVPFRAIVEAGSTDKKTKKVSRKCFGKLPSKHGLWSLIFRKSLLPTDAIKSSLSSVAVATTIASLKKFLLNSCLQL